MENPLDIVIYDKDFEFAGFVVDPIYYHFVPSWEDQGYGSIELAADNPHSDAMQAKGARMTVRHRDKHVMSGPIRSRRGTFGNPTSSEDDNPDEESATSDTITYQILDDRRILENTLAFVATTRGLKATSTTDYAQAHYIGDKGASPAGTVTGQTSYYQWPAEITNAEQAIKHIIRVNLVDRLGRDVDILPNLNRGGTIPRDILPIVRMESLNEAIQPIANYSGLGVRVWQDRLGKRLRIDVVERGEWEQTLTPESGIIQPGEYAIGTPEITRPIIGGPGETAARAWDGIEGRGNVSQVESDYNDVIEVFREASSFELIWPEGTTDDKKVAKYYPFVAGANYAAAFVANMQRMVAEGIAAGAQKSTLQFDLSETETFHYGGVDGVQLGDVIHVLIHGIPFDHIVTEAMLTFTREKGLVVTPIVGKREDDPDVELANGLAAVAKALRTIHRRK